MDFGKEIVKELHVSLYENILKKWYPLVIDKEFGGYFTNVSFDWKLAPEQEKMIVTQARHIWTTSKVAGFYDDAKVYEEYARHGFSFLKNVLWDKDHGGFFQIRDREGKLSMFQGWRNEKRTYGNAFGLYSLAALYHQTHDQEVLEFAKQVFYWIEDHAFDPKDNGYFQFFTADSKVFDLQSEYKTIADDGNELGFKDQNSSIHLLEAYTELYNVWKDGKLKTQLRGILELIRDVEVNEKGYLQLFFHPDWTPVSFRNSTDKEREANYGLDHVSFGHDYETAFLMLEGSFALGLENDTKTLTTAKKMLDHAIQFGFDESVGGFYDGGYYFKDSNTCSIIMNTKNWWAQAEALNALLLFSNIFPNEKKYSVYFLREWNYIKKNILDHQHGDWFESGIDKEPHFKTGPKSHIWKCTYHTSRALMNCITILTDDSAIAPNSNLDKRKKEMNEFIFHWKEIAAKI
jgi:cellobiose epimerase